MRAAQISGGMSFDYYQTQFALLKSRTLAASIITELRLQSNPAFLGSPDSIARLKFRFFTLWRSSLSYVSNLLGFASVEEKKPAPMTEFELGVHPGLIGRYLSLLTVNSFATRSSPSTHCSASASGRAS
jgi:uncharacterized protein involved in exopolysaccharide biosynthesis